MPSQTKATLHTRLTRCISPTALARHVRDLEAEIAVKLFDRKKRGVALTPAGTVFVREARKSLDHLQRAIDGAVAASRSDKLLLSLGYTLILDESRLREVRARFLEIALETHLEFHSAQTGTLVESVVSEKLDAAIVALPVHSEELERLSIWRSQLVLALPEDQLIAAPNTVSLASLSPQIAVLLGRAIDPAFHERLYW